MRRYLYLYVTVALDPAAFAQTTPQDHPADRHRANNRHRSSRIADARTDQVPAAQYSPLAAQGGYSRGRTSPLDAMVHALNPRDVNLGAIWERRRAWLENAGANRYFWYSFGATIAVILSWFALAWMHNDRVRERWQLAEHAADALRYAEYCKRRAKEAIDRYNCTSRRATASSKPASPEWRHRRRRISKITSAKSNDSRPTTTQGIAGEATPGGT